MCCYGNICGKCYGGKVLIVGIIIFVVAVYWPERIWHAIGILVALEGLLMLSKPQGCGHVEAGPAKPAKKAKRK